MRIIGAVLVFFAAVCCGLFAGKYEQKRIDEAEAFLSLFEYIKNQVGYFLTPTKLIYRGFENVTLSDVGFLEKLRSHENDEIYFDVWGEAFRACEDALHLSAELEKARTETLKNKKVYRTIGFAIGAMAAILLI